MPPLSLTSTIALPGGVRIPQLGLGVYQAPTSKTAAAIATAISVGYRHVDCAQYYGNEKEMGEAVREYVKGGRPRSDLFVTTKFMNRNSLERNYAGMVESHEKIGLEYVDLFLIHAPSGGPEARKMAWSALERFKRAGLTKSIGVSNFSVAHIREVEAYAQEPIAVNQIELHPFLQQKKIVEYCKERGIGVQAYCPLVRGDKKDDPVLGEVAKESGKSWAQVLIRWSLQKGYIPLPKSDDPTRIASNADVYDFELSPAQMEKLDSLDCDYHATWDPTVEA